MKFSTREDIEAPVDFVCAQITDFASLERRAMRNGAQVSRRDDGPIAQGTTWNINFEFRGRPRDVTAVLTTFNTPDAIAIESASDGMMAVTQIDLVALSQSRTRILVSFELRAKSMTARLLLQSLRLAKSKMNKRFETRTKDYAEEIEDRYRRDL
jgi:hypothetical protein